VKKGETGKSVPWSGSLTKTTEWKEEREHCGVRMEGKSAVWSGRVTKRVNEREATYDRSVRVSTCFMTGMERA